MFEKFDNISGIYKIVFPNNKVYIGLSSNIRRRLIAHNKTNDDLPVHRAIKKYGKISEENVELIRNSSLSFEQIAEKFNCSSSTISHINNGKHYPNASYTYPLRKKKKTTTKLSQENLNKICELIQNTNISFTQIARDFNLSSSTVGRINSGKYHFDENKSYPLRKK